MSAQGGPHPAPPAGPALARQRWRLLQRVEHALELPMTLLGIAWLVLMVLEFVRGLSPMLQVLTQAIWVVFVLHFLLEFTLAPAKGRYLRRNWLTALALAAPALRLLRVLRLGRVLRAARVARSLRLLRVLSSINRGLGALGSHMQRRGFGYVLSLTLLVTLAGSAGMYAFEREHGLRDFGSALWFTAMLMTTMGSEQWPQTPEGRLLCLLLALYAFAVFGYVTATLASFFVGRDNELQPPPADPAAAELAREVAALRAQVERLLARSEGRAPPADNQRT